MIAVVKQENGWFNIYDENGNRTGCIPDSSGSDQMVGFTSTTVSVKSNG